MLRWVSVLVVVAFVANGCGGDAVVNLTLLTPPSDNPFKLGDPPESEPAVTVLFLVVHQKEFGHEIFSDGFAVPVDPDAELRIELPALPNDETVLLDVRGFLSWDFDPGDEGQHLARGFSSWIRAEPNKTYDLEVCFCRRALVETGFCTDACKPTNGTS